MRKVRRERERKREIRSHISKNVHISYLDDQGRGGSSSLQSLTAPVSPVQSFPSLVGNQELVAKIRNTHTCKYKLGK